MCAGYVGVLQCYTYRDFIGLGMLPPIIKNRMEKKMEREMESGMIHADCTSEGLRRAVPERPPLARRSPSCSCLENCLRQIANGFQGLVLCERISAETI